MTWQPLRLIVGGVGPADFGAFIPIDAQPAKAVQDRRQGRFDVALLVGIVDPQLKLPAVPPGEEPIEERRADAADMQIARRAGSEASANH